MSGRRPYVVIVSTILICIIFAAMKYSLQEEENRPQELWVAQDTPAKEDYNYLDGVWPSFQVIDAILITAKDGESVLTSDGINELYDIHQSMKGVNVTVTKGSQQGEWNYEKKCDKKAGICWRTNYLDVYDESETLIRSLDQTEIDARNNNDSYWTTNVGDDLNRNTVLGEIARVGGDDSDITGAQAILTTYVLYLEEDTDGGTQ
eukprot:UN33687